MEENLSRLLARVQKPARYTGGELNQTIKDKAAVDCRFAFCFPDTYEIGMSHLGMKILYDALNRMDGVWCERVFAPAEDMETAMREEGVPLYGLESYDPLTDFDMIGFTLQYELSYTNLLNMLNLGGIPVFQKDRGEGLQGIVIAGGPCAVNPEPLADFVDLFNIGEGEYMLPEVVELYRKAKRAGLSRSEFLNEAAQIEGIYVPSLYTAEYHSDGTISAFIPHEGAPARVKKRIVRDLDEAPYPPSFPVPFIETVHDRVILEVMRGCIRGCRFCQAGFLYRPLREKSPKRLCEQAKSLCETTGYEEISLSSLSTSDFSGLPELLRGLLPYTAERKINLALPSLRVDNFSEELLEQIQSVRKSGLTFAPEAGTQRLRDVINKNVTEDEVLRSMEIAFSGGHTGVKLYFMMGLPTETPEDIAGIIELAQKVVDLFYHMPQKPKGKGVQVSVSVSTFVPKPFTPFQWEPQDTMEVIRRKQAELVSHNKSKKISVHYHESKVSVLEGILARGDRRLGRAIYTAWQKGCKMDGWSDRFRFDLWMDALAECGLDPAFYANRRRSYEEILPWDFIDVGVDKAFLIRENEKAKKAETTPHCRAKCAGCGANRLKGEGVSCF